MTFDLASIVVGATVATLIVGLPLVIALLAAQADLAILTEARDRNADDFVDERTRRMMAENHLGEADMRIAEFMAPKPRRRFRLDDHGGPSHDA